MHGQTETAGHCSELSGFMEHKAQCDLRVRRYGRGN